MQDQSFRVADSAKCRSVMLALIRAPSPAWMAATFASTDWSSSSAFSVPGWKHNKPLGNSCIAKLLLLLLLDMLTCTFRTSCYSTRLSWAHTPVINCAVCLRLYGVRHMVKDHSDSEKGNPLSPHRLLLSINSKGSFICTIPQTG